MRVIKGLFIVIVVLIGGVVGVSLLLPDSAHAERSIVIDASPATVYTALNGFHQFAKWSPWAGLDPNTVYRNEGPWFGVGAKQSWVSEDPNVGAGSQEIIEAQPYQRIRIRLIFSGFDADNYSSYVLQPEGNGTRLTWHYDASFNGNLLGRYFGLILDKMIGPDYEQGLQKLKALVETLPPVAADTRAVEVAELSAKPIVYLSGVTPAAQAMPALVAALGELRAYFAAHGLIEAEPPLAITREFNDEARNWSFEAALVPTQAVTIEDQSRIRAGVSYAGHALRMVYRGPYADMDEAYNQLMAFKTTAGLEDNGASWEQYPTDPTSTADAERVTHIYWPVK